MSRRSFLRGASVALSLPLLDAMVPAFARSAPAARAPGSPRRMLAIQTNLGILPHFFWPEVAGMDVSVDDLQQKGKIPHYSPGAIRDYKPSPYLEILKDYRGAAADYSSALHIYPAFADAYYHRGLVRHILKDNAGAVADLQKAAKLYTTQGNKSGYAMAEAALRKIGH